MANALAFQIETGGGIWKRRLVVRSKHDRTAESTWSSWSSISDSSIRGGGGRHRSGLDSLRHEFLRRKITDLSGELNLVGADFPRVIDSHFVVLELEHFYER